MKLFLSRLSMFYLFYIIYFRFRRFNLFYFIHKNNKNLLSFLLFSFVFQQKIKKILSQYFSACFFIIIYILQDLLNKITTMKMMFHIDDFKCTLCANWFCPPFNLPYLLPCTHSICTSCLQKASSNDHIICPQDLESCPIHLININLTTKKALERLMKEHKNYNQNTQLQCIKSLSIGFDQILSSKEKQLRSLQALIDQIFHSEIERLRHIHQKIKIDINRPYRVVQDWKQIVASHLTNIRKNHQSSDSRSNHMLQLNHYIEQGRKIKMELNQFFQLEFDLFADRLMRMPRACFDKDFSVNADTLQNKLKIKYNRENLNSSNLSINGKINTTADITKTKQKQKQKQKQRQIQREIHRQRQKRILTCQSGSQSDNYDHIGSSTVLITGQNKKNSNRTPLQPIDSNIQKFLSSTNQNQNLLENQQIPIQTKRGNNKQKSFNSKTPVSNYSQSHNLDRYIGTQTQKAQKSNRSNFNLTTSSQNIHSKNTGKQNKDKQVSGRSKNKHQLTSPGRGIKGKQIPANTNNKGKNQPKFTRNFVNDGLTEKKNQEFNLTQFQLQAIQNQNDSIVKDHSKVSTKQLNVVSPNRTKTKKIIEKQSPPSLAFSAQFGQFGQQQRMNKLAHMLDNASSQGSNNNSQRNSSKNIKNYLQVQQPNLHQISYQTNSLLMSPNTIRQQYTEQAQSQVPYQEEQLLNNDDMLISDNQTGWQLSNINFLRQWKLKNQNNVEHPLQIRQNTYYYNCEKQKLSYMRKMQIHRVQQALKLTLVKDNFIQLINQSLHDVDMTLYLEQFDWKHSNIEIVKFVKTSLSDEQLNILLNFLAKSTVKALVLSGNNLSDLCLDAFLNFVTVNSMLKNVYLPKNYINILKSKSKINLLKQKGINIYI